MKVKVIRVRPWPGPDGDGETHITLASTDAARGSGIARIERHGRTLNGEFDFDVPRDFQLVADDGPYRIVVEPE